VADSTPGAPLLLTPPDDTPTQAGGEAPPVPPPPQSSWVVRAAALQAEYVAGGSFPFLSQYLRALPHYIDDTTRDFGDDLYERMLLDGQVSSAIRLLKEETLANGVRLEPAIQRDQMEWLPEEPGLEEYIPARDVLGRFSPAQDASAKDKADEESKKEADLSEKITDFCENCLLHLERPLVECLYEMLDALALGNKIAEQVWEVRRDEDDVPRLFLKALKVKPRKATAFVMDPYMNLVGILGAIPGQAFPVLSGNILSQPGQVPNFLPREKFAIFTWNSQAGDPRGNALDPETPIPTPDGWKKLDQLQPGDKVFDEQGRIRYVTARKDWEDRPCYRLTFRDHSSIIADENHLWKTQLLWERSKRTQGKVRTTKQIVSTLKNSQGQTNHGIPWAEPLDYPEQILPVHPYFLGLWLGDGTSSDADIACHVDDAEETSDKIRGCGYSTGIYHSGPEGSLGRRIQVQGKRKWDSSGPSVALRILGVINNKHIPPVYLRGSIQQRRDLLAGLMDSDGYVGEDGRCEFANTNMNLVRGVAELVRSLGVNAVIRKRRNVQTKEDGKTIQDAWSVFFTPPWPPFRLKRKCARARVERGFKYHYIVKAERVANRRTVCIEVDSPSHLFLAGESMVPTHNSILRQVYNPWWLKMQVWGEYAKYLVKFAGPALVGYTAPNAQPVPPQDALGNPIPGVPLITPEQAMLNALLNFAQGQAVVFTNGSRVEPLLMQGDGGAYRNAITLFNMEITKGVLCQTLATEAHTVQARAASETHMDVLDIVILHIKALLASMIGRDILYRLVKYNWGEDVARKHTPKVHLAEVERHNWPTTASAVAALVTSQYLDRSQFPEMDARLGLPKRNPASIATGPVAPTGRGVPMPGGAGGISPPAAGAFPGGPPTSPPRPTGGGFPKVPVGFAEGNGNGYHGWRRNPDYRRPRQRPVIR
jgi:hypothetical protein